MNVFNHFLSFIKEIVLRDIWNELHNWVVDVRYSATVLSNSTQQQYSVENLKIYIVLHQKLTLKTCRMEVYLPFHLFKFFLVAKTQS